MELKEGVSVYTSDGKAAGRLNRVVIDPETNEVTHIVIQKGLINKEDIVVEAQKIDTATPEEVRLLYMSDELKLLPPFQITHYATVNSQSTSPGYMLYATPPPERSVAVETRRTIPEELIALKEGTPVCSADQEHVGNVERVITDSNSGQVTHFVIAKGLLLKERKLIPIDMADVRGEDKVYLSINTHQLEGLPEYQE